MDDPNMEKVVVELSELLRSRFFGKYRGLVKRVDDPNNQGRITAIVPEVFGDKESPWAFPSSPLAGPNYGFFMLPKEHDGVWIEFEAGDPSRPIWGGFWWASDEMPSDAAENVRIIVTPGGHKLVLDDDGQQIQIVHSGGAQVTMTNDDITLTISGSTIVLSSDSVNINNGALVVQK
jgi:uncharacterized protein involved in type VI secretion and phage assembly